MRCPTCGAADSRVIDTTTDTEEIRRRRECQACGARYSTVERVRTRLPLVVKANPDGLTERREPFDPDKLRRGIRRACAKRPITDVAIDRLVAGIEDALREGRAGEVTSRYIGELVIDGLRELDEIAYIRYAIVFLGLEDLQAVRDEIDRLLVERSRRPNPAPLS